MLLHLASYVKIYSPEDIDYSGPANSWNLKIFFTVSWMHKSLRCLSVSQADVGDTCTSKSECAADECCQIINIVVMSRKRQAAILPLNQHETGTPSKYAGGVCRLSHLPRLCLTRSQWNISTVRCFDFLFFGGGTFVFKLIRLPMLALPLFE